MPFCTIRSIYLHFCIFYISFINEENNFSFKFFLGEILKLGAVTYHRFAIVTGTLKYAKFGSNFASMKQNLPNVIFQSKIYLRPCRIARERLPFLECVHD